MFNGSGAKVRKIARILFIATLVIVGVSFLIMLITAIVSGAVGALVTAIFGGALYVLLTWLGCVVLSALGEAAEYAETAMDNTYQIMNMLRKQNDILNRLQGDQETAGPAPEQFDGERVPAWKRVELAALKKEASEPEKPEPEKPEPVQAEPEKPEPVQAEPVKPEPVVTAPPAPPVAAEPVAAVPEMPPVPQAAAQPMYAVPPMYTAQPVYPQAIYGAPVYTAQPVPPAGIAPEFKFCRRCGTRMPKENAFCFKCGKEST